MIWPLLIDVNHFYSKSIKAGVIINKIVKLFPEYYTWYIIATHFLYFVHRKLEVLRSNGAKMTAWNKFAVFWGYLMYFGGVLKLFAP